ncbi:DUF3006 domain-containing protein [Butyricicoccus sp. Marseille-Q5471]|uniref:DUF3006 domain-containing protein n=1 Tax=Butyricicoccus sp. Marseille-Q5471 TaxID=3039493 RepID=UPI0024BCC7AF|nr:DUF3006 domain-containing protein [Butyricicoccus sp. Marseille-Q5471]
MKQTGIVDRFEGEFVVVEVGEQMVNFPRADAPAMLCEGMVVYIKDGRIAGIDELETQRMENDMRRRFERILGKQTDE